MSVAMTPPMGWNSWDCYGPAVSEEIVRGNADYMAKHLKQYGWEYIVVDIQWYQPTADTHEYHNFTELDMDEYSRLIPAVNRFPSAANGVGFKALGDYIHSLGLKFGIHILRGIPRQAVHMNTKIKGTDITARQIASQASICPWNTDMYGIDASKDGAKQYYDSLFELYAQWGVDYVKVDDIADHYAKPEIELIRDAIANSGRDMVLSISPGPAPLEEAEHMKEYVNLWRITDDFWDKWELLYAMFERTEKWCTHSGAGHWPDADMLPIGHILQDYDENNFTKFTKDEQITMMTLWSIFRSPLMIGGEMTKFDDFTKGLLTNQELLEMLNNSHSAHQIFRRGVEGQEKIAWMSTHTTTGYYIALFNAGEEECKIAVDTDKIGLTGEFNAFDIWEGKDIGSIGTTIKATVRPHGAKVYKIEHI